MGLVFCRDRATKRYCKKDAIRSEVF